MGTELNKFVGENPCYHWSGAEMHFKAQHICNKTPKYEDDILFDAITGKWELSGEYRVNIDFCPWCGAELEIPIQEESNNA